MEYYKSFSHQLILRELQLFNFKSMLILGLFQSSINFKGTSTIEINGCPTLSMFQSSINFKGTSTLSARTNGEADRFSHQLILRELQPISNAAVSSTAKVSVIN